LLHQHHRAPILERYQNPAAIQEDKTSLQKQPKRVYVLPCIKISIVYKYREATQGKKKVEAHNLPLLPSQDQEVNDQQNSHNQGLGKYYKSYPAMLYIDKCIFRFR
jgi:hypothetical protein